MSLVEFFKFALMSGDVVGPLTQVTDEGKKVVGHSYKGVTMDQDTYKLLMALYKDWSTRKAEVYRQHSADYATAVLELINEIQATGKAPTVDFRRRRTPMGILDLDDLEEEDLDDEYKPDTEEEEDDEIVEPKVAVSKTIPTKTEKRTKPVTKKVVEKVVEEPALIQSQSETKVEEAPKKPGRKPVKKGKATSTSVPPSEEQTPVAPSE